MNFYLRKNKFQVILSSKKGPKMDAKTKLEAKTAQIYSQNFGATNVDFIQLLISSISKKHD